MAYHMKCLDPPMETLPDEDEWYCPLCKNDGSHIVKAGEKLKESKKKLKMASTNSTSTRDWGKGMACVGRTKVCTIVPPNHFGPIPGVPVGSCWKFRVQVCSLRTLVWHDNHSLSICFFSNFLNYYCEWFHHGLGLQERNKKIQLVLLQIDEIVWEKVDFFHLLRVHLTRTLIIWYFFLLLYFPF